MSRSRRKTPVVGNTTAHSNKAFKVIEHRRGRAATRAALAAGAEEMPHAKATGNEWASPRDGKHRLGPGHENLMRK